jgi:hypothetical protein
MSVRTILFKGKERDFFDFFSINSYQKPVSYVFNEESNTLEMYVKGTGDGFTSLYVYFKKKFYDYIKENKKLPFKITFFGDELVTDFYLEITLSHLVDNESFKLIGNDILENVIHLQNDEGRKNKSVYLKIGSQSSVDEIDVINIASDLRIDCKTHKPIKKLNIKNLHNKADLTFITYSNFPVMLNNVNIQGNHFDFAYFSSIKSEDGMFTEEKLDFANSLSLTITNSTGDIVIEDERAKVTVLSIMECECNLEYKGKTRELRTVLYNSKVGKIIAEKQEIELISNNSSLQKLIAKKIVLKQLKKHTEDDFMSNLNKQQKKERRVVSNKYKVVVDPDLKYDFI